MAEKFLSAVFLPAIQAFLHSRRRKNRFGDPFASGGLAYAFRRFRGALAGGIVSGRVLILTGPFSDISEIIELLRRAVRHAATCYEAGKLPAVGAGMRGGEQRRKIMVRQAINFLQTFDFYAILL